MIQTDNVASDAAHYALSDDQSEQLDHDVNEMKAKADEISMLVSASFGGATEIAMRAGEVEAALQRLQWVLERHRAAQPEGCLPTVSEYLATHSHQRRVAIASTT